MLPEFLPPISRRSFIQFALAGIALSVPILAAPSGKKLPSKTIHASQRLYPGWIEENVDAPLIQAKKGHTAWLKQAVFRNPLAQTLTSDICQYVEKRAKAGNRLALGETLLLCINGARQALTGVDEGQISQGTNMDLEAIHLGTVAFAASFSTWLEPENMHDLGISLSGYRDVTDYYWNKDRGISRRAFPRLFGLDRAQIDKSLDQGDGQTRFSGEDRTIHFSQHLFLAFEYLYSLGNNLSDHRTLPLMLKLPMWFSQTPEERAQILSERVGFYYELSSLINPDNWPIFKDRNRVHEGVFDSMVEPDYKGNALGANTAISLWRRTLAGRSIDPIIQELNDQKFSRLETPPILTS